MEVKILEGRRCIYAADVWWRNTTDKQKRMVLWNIPRGTREQAFYYSLRNAPQAAVCMAANAPFGFCWVLPLMTGCRAGWIHFCGGPVPPAMALEAGRQCMKLLREYYDSFFALVPHAFRHVRAFARRLGFSELAEVPGACAVYPLYKPRRGVLLCHAAC